MAEVRRQLDAVVLDPVFDGTSVPVFDPERPLPVPGIVLAGDPASPDTIVREPDLARLAAHSPGVERRVITGVGHLIHDSKEHRQLVLDAVRDVLARLADSQRTRPRARRLRSDAPRVGKEGVQTCRYR